MNILWKRLLLPINTQRLKVLYLSHNICNTFHSNADNLNQKSFAGKNVSKSLLRRNGCPFSLSVSLCMALCTQPLDALTYERIADQTLEHLFEELETIIESNAELKDSDVSLSNGVITCNLGLNGIYVINKQTPNKQIWFSSPLSGPKRYDYINKEWTYIRDGTSLFNTLSKELSEILKREIKINASHSHQ